MFKPNRVRFLNKTEKYNMIDAKIMLKQYLIEEESTNLLQEAEDYSECSSHVT